MRAMRPLPHTVRLRGRRQARAALPLSLRLISTYAVLVTATLLVVAGLAIHLTRTHLRRELDLRLSAAVESFQEGPARRVQKPEDLAGEARKWLAAQAFPEEQVAAVRTAQGEVLSSSGGIDLRRVPGSLDLLTSRRSRWREVDSPFGPIRALTVPLTIGGEQAGTLVVAASRSRAQATLSALLSGIAWASGIGLAFAALLGFAAVHRTLRPLQRMSAAVDAIQATGDLSRRVSLPGPADEVGRLAEAFDRMLARLEEVFRNQRRFLADASHEMRTPLTVVRGHLELLKDRATEGEAGRSLSLALEELDRMTRIVEELLLLARLDEGLALAREPVEVELVLREALLRGMLAGRREAAVEVSPGLYVLADPDRLLQVLTNLITNAVQHGGDDVTVRMRARRDGGRVTIEVADDGPGVPQDDLPHVFERFYRGSASKGERMGAGLGLAIVDSLARAMGGEVTLRSKAGEGTTFTVSLPAASPASGAG